MMDIKERKFKVHPQVCLEQLVPEDHFYRKVEDELDLSFVRDLVKDYYSSFGRPSVDPVVFFKLQLIMFFEGIRSERQLMGQVPVNMAFRWYIGYDLDENVPNHSSLTKIRDRYGVEVFQRFFEHIVELCIQAGLVWGKELYFDGTKVHANANINSMIPRFYHNAQQHLEELFNTQQNPDGTVDLGTDQEEVRYGGRKLFQKYDGTRITGRRRNVYRRKADYWVNKTDPDASPMSRFTGDRAKLGYHTHYVIDGGKERIILAALVTPASIMDNTPMLDLVRWIRFRWRLHPDIAVGDAKYGTVYNIVGLEQDGIRAYTPTSDFSQKNDFYPAHHFQYDTERDLFICPQGHFMPLYKRSYSEQRFLYRADKKFCNTCPMKPKCTKSKSGRYIAQSFFQGILDRASAYRETEAYKKAMRKRQVWVEPLFGEGKQWHGMRKFRLRRLAKTNIEGLMRAAGQNIKRLLKPRKSPHKPTPASPMVLAISIWNSFFA